MTKFVKVCLALAFMIGAYLLMLVVTPLLSDVISTANTSMAASSNMSNYFGTAEFFLSMPLIIWFIPAVFTLITIVAILKTE